MRRADVPSLEVCPALQIAHIESFLITLIMGKDPNLNSLREK